MGRESLLALHIIFIVTWFAGLFYIVRLFIYFVEAEKKAEAERLILQNQYRIMQRRLWYGITWPSMVLTVILGSILLYPYLLQWDTEAFSWLVVKLGMVAGLIVYHLYCGTIYQQLQKGVLKFSSFQLRLYNEIATIFLVVIVFAVKLKSQFSFKIAAIAVLALVAVIIAVTVIYKKLREK